MIVRRPESSCPPAGVPPHRGRHTAGLLAFVALVALLGVGLELLVLADFVAASVRWLIDFASA